MATPRISIIIPVYNAEKFLHRCINSILDQDYTDFELILVDDGSTDSSGIICEAFSNKDHRIRIFHKENGGVSSARNFGLKQATGELITFVDADDYVFNNWLKTFIDNFEINTLVCQGVKSNIDFFGYNERRKYSNISFISKTTDGIEYIYEDRVLGYIFLKLFEKRIIENANIRFNEKIRYREDELFIIDYCKFCTQIKSIENIGYFYNIDPNWESKYTINLIDQIYEQETNFKSLELIDGISQKNIFVEKLNLLIDSYFKAYQYYKSDIYLDRIYYIVNKYQDKTNINTAVKFFIKKCNTPFLYRRIISLLSNYYKLRYQSK